MNHLASPDPSDSFEVEVPYGNGPLPSDLCAADQSDSSVGRIRIHHLQQANDKGQRVRPKAGRVWPNMAKLRGGKVARFVRQYADIRTMLSDAAKAYGEEVRSGSSPVPGTSSDRSPAMAAPVWNKVIHKKGVDIQRARH